MIFASRCVPGAFLLACAVLGGLPVSTGCSYLFVTAPKDEAYGIPVAGDCTTNAAAPVIDTLLSTTNLFSTLYVSGENNVTNKGQAVTVGLLATGLWLSSAIYGYSNVSKCSALRAEEGDGPYHRPVRVRRTVLSGPPQPAPAPVQPPQLQPQPVSPSSSPQAQTPPAPYPSDGAGGAGGMSAPAAPPSAAPVVPPVRQQLDEDSHGPRGYKRK